MVIGGRCEIRTHERVAPLPVFKTGALNRSANLPCLLKFLLPVLVRTNLKVSAPRARQGRASSKTGALNRSANLPCHSYALGVHQGYDSSRDFTPALLKPPGTPHTLRAEAGFPARKTT